MNRPGFGPGSDAPAIRGPGMLVLGYGLEVRDA